MNKLKGVLALTLAQAVALAGINCYPPPPPPPPPPVCTPGSGGGSSTTPPSFSLPATVLGVQSTSNGPTDFTLTVTVPTTYTGTVLTDTSYGVWCTNPAGFVPGSIVDLSQNPPALFDPSGVATYTVFNSYAYSTYTASSDTGFPGKALGGSPTLTLSQEWNAVNYVLNHLSSNNTTYTTAGGTATPVTLADVQAVIWQLLHPTDGVDYLTQNGANAAAGTMYDDAVANGLSFIPGPGQLAALILVPQTPAASPEPFQGVLVPVTVPGASCTSTSHVTISKTANVGTTAGAFQLVTYTYVVSNTGANTLTNLVVTDDNGTPNFPYDDFTVGTIASLNPGASATLQATAYLPLTFFAQSGTNAIYDTMIPQYSSSTGQFTITYLVDGDVVDNTYNATNPTINGLVGDSGEFQIHDALGNRVLDFNLNYLTKSSSFPSGYGSTGAQIVYGNGGFITEATSSLSNNLNSYPKFKGDTTVSPTDPDWITAFGYQFAVKSGVLGWFNWSWSASVSAIRLNETKFGGPLTYSPKLYGGKVTSTATVVATVPCCNATICAKTTLCINVTTCPPPPTCQQGYAHKCEHTGPCHCTCGNCMSGHCEKCTQSTCGDVRCGDKGCPQQCQCPCVKCRSGQHDFCIRAHCNDTICHKFGCKQH